MNKTILLLLTFALFQCKSAPQSASTATLENTYWRLADMNGKPLVTPPNAKEVHMILTSTGNEKRIKGFAGCNSMGGGFTLDGNKIHFTILSTKMYCQDTMEVEDFFFKVLGTSDTYEIKGEELYLYQGETKIASFKSVYLK